MKEYLKKNYFNVLIWGTVGFFTVLYVSLIFNINVTTDEIFTINTARLGPKGIMNLLLSGGDDHPPLYYLYSSFFEFVFYNNIHAQKFASIIPMTATLVLIATLYRKIVGNLSTFLTLLFFCCVPCTMEYAVQIRMYSLAIFLVTLCGIECYEAYVDGKIHNWIILSVAALAAAYTVYFALIAVCFEVGILFLFILFNKNIRSTRIKPFIISAVSMIVLYLPWVSVFMGRIKVTGDDYFLPDITLAEFWNFFKWTFDLETIPGFVYLYVILLVATGVAGIWLIIKGKSRLSVAGFMAMLIPTLTTFSGIIISKFQSPIYTGRYVIIEMMQLAMFFGIVMGEFIGALQKNEDSTNALKGKILILAVTIFLLISGAFQYYECFKQEYVGHMTEETIAFFDEHLGPNDYVLYNYEAMGFEYRFYFPNDRLYYVRDFDFENTEYENLWFLSNLYEWPITDADCYTYWISYEFMGTYGIEDNNFDVYRYYHNDFPKIEVE